MSQLGCLNVCLTTKAKFQTFFLLSTQDCFASPTFFTFSLIRSLNSSSSATKTLCAPSWCCNNRRHCAQRTHLRTLCFSRSQVAPTLTHWYAHLLTVMHTHAHSRTPTFTHTHLRSLTHTHILTLMQTFAHSNTHLTRTYTQPMNVC